MEVPYFCDQAKKIYIYHHAIYISIKTRGAFTPVILGGKLSQFDRSNKNMEVVTNRVIMLGSAFALQIFWYISRFIKKINIYYVENHR